MSIVTKLSRWWLDCPLIKLRYKKSAYRYLSQRGENRDIPFSRDFFGLRYEGNLNNGIEFAIFYYGAFEKPLLFFLRDAAHSLTRHHRTALCFCDIGSNVGQHALFMAQHVTQVHAFEPYPLVRDRLAHHMVLNKLENIEVHPVGLGAEDSTLTFFAPSGSNQGIGSFIKGNNQDGTGLVDMGELPVVKGDNYFKDKGIPLPQLIKIDVEGFERQVLAGMNTLLSQARPIVVCELTYGESQSFQNLAELQQALPQDYLIYHFDIRKTNGRTDRRRGSRAKRTGAYRLSPLPTWRKEGQDDIVAIPQELAELIPLSRA